MIFEYDPAKAKSNLAKHGISFATAQAVWDDPYRAILTDRYVDGQQRYHAIGMVGPVAVLVVVHIYPESRNEERVRIISARLATRHERRAYEEGA